MNASPSLSSVTIIVVSYISAHCLAALHPLLQHCPHIIVSDNASGDDTAAQAQARWPQATVLAHERNLGFGAATNRAATARSQLTAIQAALIHVMKTGQGQLIDMAQANFDFVVIDMPKTVVAWTETVLNAAHVYFALLELDLRSAQNVLRMLRALKAEGLPHEKLRYVLNRAPKFTDLSAKSRVKRMAESLDISLEVQLPDGGTQVTQANDHGLPLQENAGKNPLRKEIAKLAKSLIDINKSDAAAGKN